MDREKANFTCDGVYHYSPTPQPCGHKEGVICTAVQEGELVGKARECVPGCPCVEMKLADRPMPDKAAALAFIEKSGLGGKGAALAIIADLCAEFSAEQNASLIKERDELKAELAAVNLALGLGKRENPNLDKTPLGSFR